MEGTLVRPGILAALLVVLAARALPDQGIQVLEDVILHLPGPVGQLAVGLIDSIGHFVSVELGDCIEGGHERIISAQVSLTPEAVRGDTDPQVAYGQQHTQSLVVAPLLTEWALDAAA